MSTLIELKVCNTGLYRTSVFGNNAIITFKLQVFRGKSATGGIVSTAYGSIMVCNYKQDIQN